ncbi:MAG: hypothetical protein WCH34_05940 [Bacteroidota bacterium]
MKKTIILIIFISVYLFKVNSQSFTDSGKITIHDIDSTLSKVKDDKDNESLSIVNYRLILKKQFNAVINSSGKNTIGNYASADIKDGHLAFNATKICKNGNMLSMNLNGGVTDGLFAIFNQTKINSNVGGDLKYNILFSKCSYLSYSVKEKYKLNTLLRIADDEFILDTINGNRTIIKLKLDSNLIENEIKSLNILIESLNPKKDNIKLDSLNYQLTLKKLALDSIKLKSPICNSAVKSDSYKKQGKSKLNSIEAFEYRGIRFQWISIGIGFQNNNFNLFKPSFSTLDSQIIKQNYTTWNITAEWNLYKWDNRIKYSTYYLLVGGKFSKDDNFSDLSKVELNDTYQYGHDSIIERTVNKKITVYKGDYKTKLISAKFYFDFYYFFLGNSTAIHIYPEVNLKQHYSPYYNSGIGLLFSFTDSKDKDNKAKLNAEIYLKLSDLTNTSNSDLSILGRNELGLRLSIPVSFFNF